MLFRRRDLPRSALSFRRGKTDVVEPFGWPLKPCFIGVSKPANGPRPGGPPSSFPSFTAMLLRRGEVEGAICPAVAKRTFLSPLAGHWNLFYWRFKAGNLGTTDLPRSALALPLRRGKTDVFEPFGWPLNLALSMAANGPRPGGRPSSLPSFTAMVLRCGEGCFFEGAQCPAISGKTDVFEPFGWPLNLVLSQQMGHDLAALRAAFHPSVPCCSSVARGAFSRAGGTFLSLFAGAWTLFYWRFKANGPQSSCPSRSLPSFTAMLLKRGEGCLFPSWRLRFEKRSALLPCC